MKKTLIILLTCILLLSLAGCGSKKDETNEAAQVTENTDGNAVVEIGGQIDAESKLTEDGCYLGGYDSSNATQIELGKKIPCRLEDSIVSWYTFTAEEKGNYDITLTNQSDDKSIFYCIYDGNYINVTGNKEVTDSYTWSIENQEKNSVYYILIYSMMSEFEVGSEEAAEEPGYTTDFTLNVSRQK